MVMKLHPMFDRRTEPANLAPKEYTMSYARKYISICAVLIVFAFLETNSFGRQPLAANNPKCQEKERVAAPVNIAILIQDDLVSHVSNELNITREFIRSLPEG